MARQTAAQLAIPIPPLPSRRRGGRYEAVSDPEAVAMGGALIAQLRGQELTLSQRALLARARSEMSVDERSPTPIIDTSETLLTLGRGPDAEVRVSWRRYKGSSPFLDVRRFERGDRGVLRPTRQGITIRGNEVARLLTTLVELRARGDD